MSMADEDNDVTSREAAREPWHFDRRVNIALIVTILLQTAGAVVWAAKLEERVAHLELMEARAVGEAERLARVEEKIGAQNLVLDRIDRRLERMEEGRRR
ncbi:MAG: hypothetical protein NW200_04785 [Hyphomonadaceae bacterium]|nr:hypothetical protein [Hyphomonadaceae bacterium]